MSEEQKIAGHYGLLHPTEFVKACDLKGKDVTVVVDFAKWEVLTMMGGKKDRKVAIHLRTVSGKPLGKRLIANKTNLRSIAGVLGETDVAKWSGQRISLYPTTCRGADGKQVECIRIRGRVNGSAVAADLPDEMTEAPLPRVSFVDEAEEPAAKETT